MSKFSTQHYAAVVDVIKDWIKLNPVMLPRHVDSLVNGFIITFKADNNEFCYRKFQQAIFKGEK